METKEFKFKGTVLNGFMMLFALVSSENPYQFKAVTTDLEIVAKFNSLAASVLTCTTKAGCENMGIVSVSPTGTVDGNSHKINSGTQVTVTATPNTGHQFVRWEDGSGSTLSTNATYSWVVSFKA